MFCVKRWQHGWWLLLVMALTGCNEITDDLTPSGDDKRPTVEANTVGHLPGQIAPAFTIRSSLDEDFVLADHLSGGAEPADAVVLYFTMWCPVCLAHSDHMFNNVIPQFASRGDVVYAMVDYVSGSVITSRAAETANGYAGSAFVTLVDTDRSVMDLFNAAMGTVVVITADGEILLNEDYRSGEATITALDGYLP